MNTLVVAPHPDDELIGCGGTLLRRLHAGGDVGVVIMTSINSSPAFSEDIKQRRETEIETVRSKLGVDRKAFFKLDYPTTELDQVPMSLLVNSLSEVFSEFQPEEVFLPCPVDVHSDHRVTFEAAGACTKRFRYPSIKRVATYETVSETDFAVDSSRAQFSPNYFVDISCFVKQKNELLSIYASEFSDAPFPRSLQVINSLASLRGAQMGAMAAEAFQIIRQFE